MNERATKNVTASNVIHRRNNGVTTDGRRPTTDDRRPTTDDRRPTTDDRRPTTLPTTNDQRAASLCLELWNCETVHSSFQKLGDGRRASGVGCLGVGAERRRSVSRSVRSVLATCSEVESWRAFFIISSVRPLTLLQSGRLSLVSVTVLNKDDESIVEKVVSIVRYIAVPLKL